MFDLPSYSGRDLGDDAGEAGNQHPERPPLAVLSPGRNLFSVSGEWILAARQWEGKCLTMGPLAGRDGFGALYRGRTD